MQRIGGIIDIAALLTQGEGEVCVEPVGHSVLQLPRSLRDMARHSRL
jgi:hypothetical protein